jgi:hypothetical protein
MVWVLLGLLAGCGGAKEPIKGASCNGNERRCDTGNTAFVCDGDVWTVAPPYCVCVADADDDGFGEVQCAAVALLE